MAENYNIYLHSDGGVNGGASSNTKPFSNREESANPNSVFKTAEHAFKQTQEISNEGAGALVNMGVSALAKASPWVALAVATAKITISTIDKVSDLQAEYTGDYSFNIWWSNFKTEINNAINPFAVIKYTFNRNMQYEKKNIEVAEKRRLFGNTYNVIKNKGV